MSIHSLNEIRVSRLAAWRLVGICCLLALANDLVSNFDGVTLLFVVQVAIALGLVILFFMPRLSRQNFLRPLIIVPSLLLVAFGMLLTLNSSPYDTPITTYVSPLLTVAGTPFYCILLLAFTVPGLFAAPPPDDNISGETVQPAKRLPIFNRNRIGSLFCFLVALAGLCYVPMQAADSVLAGAAAAGGTVAAYLILNAILSYESDIAGGKERQPLSVAITTTLFALFAISFAALLWLVFGGLRLLDIPYFVIFLGALAYVLYAVPRAYRDPEYWFSPMLASLTSSCIASLLGVLGYALLSGETVTASSVWIWCSAIAFASIGTALFGSYVEPIVVDSLAEMYPDGIRPAPKSKWAARLEQAQDSMRNRFFTPPISAIPSLEPLNFTMVKRATQLILADLGIVAPRVAIERQNVPTEIASKSSAESI
jgi:hypothetical protein